MTTIPLFPLHTVLFPGGPLRLRIFEPRYLTMIGRCMREESGFGVALIEQGREAGGRARTVGVGTLARIVDFEQLAGGLLGITALGERRFRIVAVHIQDDGLNLADVDWLSEQHDVTIPHEHEILAQLLQRAFEQAGSTYAQERRYNDASWVSMRLAEILPLQSAERQEMLEMDDARERLNRLRARLDLSGLSSAR